MTFTVSNSNQRSKYQKIFQSERNPAVIPNLEATSVPTWGRPELDRLRPRTSRIDRPRPGTVAKLNGRVTHSYDPQRWDLKSFVVLISLFTYVQFFGLLISAKFSQFYHMTWWNQLINLKITNIQKFRRQSCFLQSTFYFIATLILKLRFRIAYSKDDCTNNI